MSVTLNDVAKLAGVSSATVSRVINSENNVSQKTTDIVMKAILELDYAPNEYARSLKQNSNIHKTGYSIGVIIAAPIALYRDPFFHEILTGIHSQIFNTGHSIAFIQSIKDVDISKNAINLENHDVDGVILLGRFSKKTVDIVKKQAKNLLYAGINQHALNFDMVTCDGSECAKLATEHLISKGYETIGFIGKSPDENDKLVKEIRFDGYMQAMKEHNIEINRNFFVFSTRDKDEAFEKVSIALRENKIPRAYFCANDYCAAGAIKAIQKAKLDVPNDIAIASVDDINIGVSTTPLLTSVRVPRMAIGEYAVKMIIDKIETKRNFPIHISLPHKLIIRGSSG